MNLVFIYGPPASGKLTIAQELHALTGYILFDNHLTLNKAKEVAEWGTLEFKDLVKKNRLEYIQDMATRKEKGLIFTYVYEGTARDNEFVDEIKTIIAQAEGTCTFVELSCPVDELKKRVGNTGRKENNKISSVEKLEGFLNGKSGSASHKNTISPQIVIDTSCVSAQEAAQNISTQLPPYNHDQGENQQPRSS